MSTAMGNNTEKKTNWHVISTTIGNTSDKGINTTDVSTNISWYVKTITDPHSEPVELKVN